MFILNRRTKILCDAVSVPIRNAISILKRDIDDCLSGGDEPNVIRLSINHGMSDEEYRVCINGCEISIEYRCDLGAIYGLLSLSERYLAVKPFDFWNGRIPHEKRHVEIPAGEYASPSYAVRYRCWMINDEVLIDGWKNSHDEELAVWSRIFETVLRCGGNMVIPGTDRKSDELAVMALDAGLWITQHHTELLGARMFARVYPELTPSYTEHAKLFEGLWQEAIDKFAGRKVLWAVGYRGQGDYAFWEAEKAYDSDASRGQMIVSVMRRQMELVREKEPTARFCTNLYGEMMDIYRKGHMDIPAEVIKLWGDNGYGKMVSRRQGNDNPRVPSMPSSDDKGDNGLYYHASFYDLQAANHITMSPNPPELITGELTQAIQNNAAACWVINVGSIKPHVYILDLIREIWTTGRADTTDHARIYSQHYYENESVASLLLDYAKHTVPYGPNEDDRAGDQYYHFPLRTIACRLLRGETQAFMQELLWDTGNMPFERQVEMIGRRCAESAEGWHKYLQDCEKTASHLNTHGSRLLSDTLILQTKLHLTGCEGLRDFCQAVLYLLGNRPVEAYLCTYRALCAHREGVRALCESEHDEFVNYYRNECFSNVRLTVRVIETVRSWIRACFDGDSFYNWERQYLMPKEDTRVMCLTHRTNQMDDDTLCEALSKNGRIEYGNDIPLVWIKQ